SFRSLTEKVLPNPELNRGAFSQKSLIDFHVVSRHATSGKATFECFPAPMALKARQPLNGARRFLDFLDDESGDTVLHNFRHGAVRPRDHRSAAGHRLDHHQAERFWPVNREKQRVCGAQKFFLLLPPYLADEFDQWRGGPAPGGPRRVFLIPVFFPCPRFSLPPPPAPPLARAAHVPFPRGAPPAGA